MIDLRRRADCNRHATCHHLALAFHIVHNSQNLLQYFSSSHQQQLLQTMTRTRVQTTKQRINVALAATGVCFFLMRLSLPLYSVRPRLQQKSPAYNNIYLASAWISPSRLQSHRFRRPFDFSTSTLSGSYSLTEKNHRVSVRPSVLVLSTSLSSLSNQDPANPSAEEADLDDNDPSKDTIFALSSGFLGNQATAVAVIRISGPEAHQVLQSMITSNIPKPRQAALKKLFHPPDGSILDHALVLLFEHPHSFTGEDLVELQCHGSQAIIQRLLMDVLPSLQCRMAEPGEFTQRAFSNGKLDLIQVEALADVLSADTQSQVQQALLQLDGKVSKIYSEWRKQLVSGLAHAEAVIDFGDDEHLGDGADVYFEGIGLGDETADEALRRQQENVWGEVTAKMKRLQQSMEDHLEDGRRGELIREGVKIAIVGPPNAGKSSLFNVLARRDAAIVSPIAGTTRDVLQVSLDLGGVKCTLQDTAGVHSETIDILELEGMKRAQDVVKKADLVVAMVDSTDAFTGVQTVQQVLNEAGVTSASFDPKRLMLVKNKLDLTSNDETKNVPSLEHRNGKSTAESLDFGGGTFEMSCRTQEGIDSFLDALTLHVRKRTEGDNERSNGEGALITRARHRQHVEAAVAALERFSYLSAEGSMAVDMAAEELRLAASELGRITGAVDVEDVLDVLFADFCIGK
ncbi:tRNA modification GTPase [Nitzschia inconspicua]|uniref:tRNA modification GTPase n=1 Tax=Nitzschia inconspicua TaxID=303405 RepID=A0A9K3P911_9STRA|nr:tRNA modification GTPase [Nitzschia inconspicua]KAG7364112.1 tRNA modification GTPase [Nitzschia inconspicua]